VEEFPVEVIKNSICKRSTLKDIQTILQRVVCDKEGLGKKAGNPYFHVSGKTGTAQVSNGSGYKGGKNEHLVSFCGYYPSEEPKYSCIVAIRHSYYVASGGGQAGVVFSKIAQRVYSKNVTTNLKLAQDSTAIFVPDVKASHNKDYKNVLASLGLKQSNMGAAPTINDVMEVPDVRGLGARDAVYELASRGLKVRSTGRGVVTKQSIAGGAKLEPGQTILIELN
jgi:cell division protein FtsI (penicillin-binding protein 3)